MNRLEQIAQFMLDQHNSKQNYENLPETLMPKDFDEAYKIQKIFQENSGRGSLGGYKIALLLLEIFVSDPTLHNYRNIPKCRVDPVLLCRRGKNLNRK